MKVLLLTETLLPGGAETFVIRLANALTGHADVTVAVLHGELIERQLAAHLSEAVRLRTLTLPAKRSLLKAESASVRLGLGWSPVRHLATRWLRRLLEAERPDVLHSHLFKADLIAAQAVASARTRPAHVLTVHGDYPSLLSGRADPRLPGFRRRMADLFGKVAGVAIISPRHLELLKTCLAVPERKLRTIYNGYVPPTSGFASKTRRDLGLPEDKFLFGMVSRGVDKKGWREAIAAYQQLNRSEAALILVGEGPAIAALRREGVPEGVLLAGFSASPVEYVQHFDVGLLPTLFPHETLPTVVAEYLYCSKPVIATDVGEIGAMIQGESELAGRLLPFDGERIRIDELSGAMRELFDDQRLTQNLGRVAVQASAKFDMDRCARAYLDLYRSSAT